MSPELIIDIIGITIGAIAIYMVAVHRVGGRVGSAVSLFVWGVLFQMLAFLHTIVFSRLALFPKLPTDVHHLLMAVGMIFFVLSARQFASIVRVNSSRTDANEGASNSKHQDTQ